MGAEAGLGDGAALLGEGAVASGGGTIAGEEDVGPGALVGVALGVEVVAGGTALALAR